MSGGPASLLIKRRALLISAVAFISYAYFYQGGGWNQNSRFDLVRAIVLAARSRNRSRVAPRLGCYILFCDFICGCSSGCFRLCMFVFDRL